MKDGFLKVFSLAAMILSWGIGQGCTSGEDYEFIIKKPADEVSPKVLIANTAIAPALGYFALIMHDNRQCAVKFTEIGYEKVPKGKISNNSYGVYEWYFQGDGSGDFSRASASHGEGRATFKFVHFIGRLAFQRGNFEVNCGDKIFLTWHARTTLNFFDPRGDETEEETIRRGVKIAPTPWTDIKEVDVNDPRLNWYSYDSKRIDRWVPVKWLFKKST